MLERGFKYTEKKFAAIYSIGKQTETFARSVFHRLRMNAAKSDPQSRIQLRGAPRAVAWRVFRFLINSVSRLPAYLEITRPFPRVPGATFLQSIVPFLLLWSAWNSCNSIEYFIERRKKKRKMKSSLYISFPFTVFSANFNWKLKKIHNAKNKSKINSR